MSLDLSKMDAILAAHAGHQGALIPVLQEVQAAFGYVPEEAVNYVGDKLNISPGKIFGVLTFYAQFHLQPCGRNVVRVCCGTACHVQGGEQLLHGIKEHLKLNSNGSNTTDDGRVTLEEVACLGCCGLAPVMMVNNDVHGKLTKEKAEEIINHVK